MQAPRYEMKRYVAMNNRVMGGMMVTVQRHLTENCTSRFKRIGSLCYGSGLKADGYGFEAVSGLLVCSSYTKHCYNDVLTWVAKTLKQA